jgi:hypothetical protein
MNNTTSTSVLSLFVVNMDTVNYESEYGCMFVVAADSESAAETAVRDFYSHGRDRMPEVTMKTRRIGTANDTIVVGGVVADFTT